MNWEEFGGQCSWLNRGTVQAFAWRNRRSNVKCHQTSQSPGHQPDTCHIQVLQHYCRSNLPGRMPWSWCVWKYNASVWLQRLRKTRNTWRVEGVAAETQIAYLRNTNKQVLPPPPLLNCCASSLNLDLKPGRLEFFLSSKSTVLRQHILHCNGPRLLSPTHFAH
jgi:hypothetical protein